MAKKKSSNKLAVGTRIRVKTGVTAPEFPSVACDGWTGIVAELAGKKSDPKYLIEWDDAILETMPPAYVDDCEQKGLYYRMACFVRDEIEELAE